jgi:hypothetical protein
MSGLRLRHWLITGALFVSSLISGLLARGGWHRFALWLGWDSWLTIRLELCTAALESVLSGLLLVCSLLLLWRSRMHQTDERSERVALYLARLWLGMLVVSSGLDVVMLSVFWVRQWEAFARWGTSYMQ